MLLRFQLLNMKTLFYFELRVSAGMIILLVSLRILRIASVLLFPGTV